MAAAGPSAALVLLLCSVAAVAFSQQLQANAAGTPDGSEEWGYVQVRPSKRTHLLASYIVLECICHLMIRQSAGRGAHVLVALPQPAARRRRQDAMADRALAAGRPGELHRI